MAQKWTAESCGRPQIFPAMSVVVVICLQIFNWINDVFLPFSLSLFSSLCIPSSRGCPLLLRILFHWLCPPPWCFYTLTGKTLLSDIQSVILYVFLFYCMSNWPWKGNTNGNQTLPTIVWRRIKDNDALVLSSVPMVAGKSEQSQSRKAKARVRRIVWLSIQSVG